MLPSKKHLALFLLATITTSLFSGCFRKEQPEQGAASEPIELVYYKLYDNEDVFAPLIQEYQSNNPNITVTYRKFDDPQEYERIIINELAEGEGPDIFSMPNHWFTANTKKLSPLPLSIATPEEFEATFVNVANKDLVLKDHNDGLMKIYGLPLTVDTLALYYNKSHFEDRIPERGRPAETWDELKEDVFLLTKKDNSFERFEVSGIAMGRSDNILRWLDILVLLMIQHDTVFYTDNMASAQFSKQRTVSPSGQNINPATEALSLYTSFALPASKYYTWNAFLADSKSAEKEITTFARGKTSMIFGYSYLYEQLLSDIRELQSQGVNTIAPEDIRIAIVPQVLDPTTSTQKRDTLASYHAETVSRTSANPQAAWDFLLFLSRKENLEFYNQQTHRPTSRRDMIEDQKLDPIYGVYAEQTGFAESIVIYDAPAYGTIFAEAIDAVLATTEPNQAIRNAESAINAILPPEGLIPPDPEAS